MLPTSPEVPHFALPYAEEPLLELLPSQRSQGTEATGGGTAFGLAYPCLSCSLAPAGLYRAFGNTPTFFVTTTGCLSLVANVAVLDLKLIALPFSAQKVSQNGTVTWYFPLPVLHTRLGSVRSASGAGNSMQVQRKAADAGRNGVDSQVRKRKGVSESRLPKRDLMIEVGLLKAPGLSSARPDGHQRGTGAHSRAQNIGTTSDPRKKGRSQWAVRHNSNPNTRALSGKADVGEITHQGSEGKGWRPGTLPNSSEPSVRAFESEKGEAMTMVVKDLWTSNNLGSCENIWRHEDDLRRHSRRYGPNSAQELIYKAEWNLDWIVDDDVTVRVSVAERQVWTEHSQADRASPAVAALVVELPQGLGFSSRVNLLRNFVRKLASRFHLTAPFQCIRNYLMLLPSPASDTLLGRRSSCPGLDTVAMNGNIWDEEECCIVQTALEAQVEGSRLKDHDEIEYMPRFAVSRDNE
ncbi:hypothetical protein BJV78DRAFT_1155851 [Lactifluus subvellereus]|nr:hypothetical protein BJV78DRAFT_1155851 [Lactifluus subvellereus]